MEDYYLKLSESLVADMQKLENENNILRKYADVTDFNISIHLGYQLLELL